MGLKNASAIFLITMDNLFKDELDSNIAILLDNILV